jgi:hypothetical protein
VVSTSQTYQIYTAGEPHMLQVFYVYFFVVVYGAWIIGLLWMEFKILHVDRLPKNWDVLAVFLNKEATGLRPGQARLRRHGSPAYSGDVWGGLGGRAFAGVSDADEMRSLRRMLKRAR